jgi:hypothetical protein
VHAMRGRDEEGALRLHEALRLAEATGSGPPSQPRAESSATSTSRPAAAPRPGAG